VHLSTKRDAAVTTRDLSSGSVRLAPEPVVAGTDGASRLTFEQLPLLLTAAEAANLLRTTRKAIYARAERGLLPGAVRDRRRLLVRRDDLLRSLEERRAPSPGETRR
jgi:excisionase family DNA binding protein